MLMDKDTLALILSAIAIVIAGLSWWANARSADAAEAAANEARQARRELRIIEICREGYTLNATIMELKASLRTVTRPAENRRSAEEAMAELEQVQQQALEVVKEMDLTTKSDADLTNLLTALQGHNATLAGETERWAPIVNKSLSMRTIHDPPI